MNSTKLQPSTLAAIVGNNLLAPVFSFVNKWAIERRKCDSYIDNGRTVIWCNDYTEYILEFDDYSQECRLTGYNVELNRHVLFHIPTGQTEGFFDNIIQLVGHA
jgi:hypothetical protein